MGHSRNFVSCFSRPTYTLHFGLRCADLQPISYLMCKLCLPSVADNSAVYNQADDFGKTEICCTKSGYVSTKLVILQCYAVTTSGNILNSSGNKGRIKAQAN